MSTSGTRIQAGFEPIPGYVLTKKIGSGGYGDVWAADAPGGLKKAIKFVHGAIHEDRATAELKSLQRIRQLNHPFILSLERIEIADSQLLIVTELAQGSLFDRYIEYRERGFAGIARDRLLGYLRDAADGLDFLCQKHDLQHLDVKPGNLLLVSDRIKVADFGLVKDLHSIAQSMLGGLTPAYAAPEMFDGRPGRFSDQYSLAIVYFEMLTGVLPFRGRTTAQLANEHLHKAPNLEPLPAAERPIIAKALSKKPHQRYSDCREMIRAIETALQTDVETSLKDPNVRVRGWSPKQNPSKNANRSQSPLSKDSPKSSKYRIRPAKISDGSSASSPAVDTKSKSVVIGVGGIGARIIAELNQRCSEVTCDLEDQPILFLLDTDAGTLMPLVDRSKPGALSSRQFFHAPLKSPHYYRDETISFPQLSRRWLYNIPRSQTTEGVRPLGMLALIDHAPKVFELLQLLLEGLASDATQANPIQFKIVASTMGGTGSSISSELGFLVRQIADELEIPIQCELLLTCASPSPTALGDLATACSIACLLEVNHYFRSGGLHPELPRIPLAHSSKPPFDGVRLFYGGKAGDTADIADVIGQVVSYISVAEPIVVASKPEDAAGAEPKNSDSSDAPAWLSTVKVTQFPLELSIQPAKASATILLRGLLGWISAMDKGISAVDSPQSLLVSSRMMEKIEFFITDAFRVCNFNAQAWVKDVMRAILPSEENLQTQDFRSSYCPSACVLQDVVHLKKLVGPLGLDLSEAAVGTQQLFECRYERLVDLITSRWITAPTNWTLVPKLVELLEERLKVNAHSLFSVAKKLEAKLAELANSGAPDQAVAQEPTEKLVGKLQMEVILHHLSANILLRFIERLQCTLKVWNRCSVKLQNEFLIFAKDFCSRRFGYSFEKFLESTQQAKADSINRLSHDSIADFIHRFWYKECGCEANEASMVGAPSSNPSTRDLPTTSQMLEDIASELKREFVKQTTMGGVSTNQKATAVANTNPISGMTHLVRTATANESDFELADGVTMSSGYDTRTGPIAPDSARVSVAIQDDSDLDAKIQACIPYLAEFSESVHLHLYASEMIWYQLPEELKSKLEKVCHIRLSKRKMVSYIVAEGRKIDLEEMIDKLWMPTNETWQLVPRILSRVDIEWIPFKPAPQDS